MEKTRTKKRNMAAAVLGAGMAASFCAAFLAWNVPKVSAAAASAEEGLEMTTDYPGITTKAGETLSFSLDFDNASEEGCDAALSIESIPDGWEGYFSGNGGQVNKVHVDGSDSEDSGDGLATFKVTLPDEVEEGTYTITLKADAGSGVSDELELEVQVNESETGQSSFSVEYPEQQGASGTSFSFSATLINNKGVSQSYSLAAEAPTGWQVSFVPSGESTQVASVDVDSESSQAMTISVVPPSTLEEGEYTIPCTAISANETLSTELKVTITGSYEVDISTSTGNLSLDAYSNSEKTLTLTVTNLGNVDLENLNLSSSAPSNWEVTFDESTIETLEAGATKEVTARITPDADAMTGDYVVTMSVSNSETTDSAEFRVSVKTRTSWGIFAVAIILALLLCLRYIFKKYGRR